jgi:hypothetical protein
MDAWQRLLCGVADRLVLGTTMLAPGTHTLTVDVSGGDGCVEIDLATLQPT